MRHQRSENVRRALELRAQSMPVKQIAAEMGVYYKTVYEWLEDPTGERSNARKRAEEARDIAARSCSACGGRIGSRRAAVCDDCRQRHLSDRRAAIIALRNEGLLNTEIAARLQTTVASVANVLCRERKSNAGIKSSPYRERGKVAA